MQLYLNQKKRRLLESNLEQPDFLSPETENPDWDTEKYFSKDWVDHLKTLSDYFDVNWLSKHP